MAKMMRRFAKWHIWLGWLTGVPLVLWCLSGLVMVARPIEVVRGDHLRREIAPAALPAGTDLSVRLPADGPRVVEVASRVENGRVITRLTHTDESVARYDEGGRKLPPISDVEARLLVAARIAGGDKVSAARLTDPADPPLDFRRPIAAWQIALADGTVVYVARDSGEIAAVRTRWWRVFDFMWGIHIMDLQTREDTHHPILILFAALALIGSVLGTTLLFRRRKAPVRVPAQVGASGGGSPSRGRFPR